jgi:ATP-dependent exoDNAse (exonuclease V) alpha subunit
MLQRELLYTGMTRARTNLTVWYSGENKDEIGASSLSRGILNQAIKGKTLEAKLDYFRNKLKIEATKAQLQQEADTRAAKLHYT